VPRDCKVEAKDGFKAVICGSAHWVTVPLYMPTNISIFSTNASSWAVEGPERASQSRHSWAKTNNARVSCPRLYTIPTAPTTVGRIKYGDSSVVPPMLGSSVPPKEQRPLEISSMAWPEEVGIYLINGVFVVNPRP